MKRKTISTFKISFLLALLMLGFLLISGCSPLDLIFGPSGSINVDTYPSGAKVFLNGSNTGKITPCTITNLMKESYKVKVTLGDLSYTETVMVYSGCLTSVYKDLIPRLKEIIAKPDILYTKIGETRNFSTITTYYYDIDHWPKEIKLSDCSYTKNNNDARINSGEGTFTGVSKGITQVAISYTEGEFTESDTLAIFVCITPVYPVSPPGPEPGPEPEPDEEILKANIVIVSREQLGNLFTIYYEIENTGNVDIGFYEVWFTIKCSDNSEYIGWDIGSDVKVGKKKMGICIKIIEGKTVVSVSIRNSDLMK